MDIIDKLKARAPVTHCSLVGNGDGRLRNECRDVIELSEAERNALLALVAPKTWQPVETIPRDGRWIWVRMKGRAGRVTALRWDAEYAARDCPWFAGMGWYSAREYDGAHVEAWADMASQPPDEPAPPSPRPSPSSETPEPRA